MKVNIGKYFKRAIDRRISVEIERHDSFSMDHTLSYVILPMLIQLKECKHGIPHEFAEVGGADYEAQESFDFYKETHNECFDKGVERWNEVLDKMIWSFEQILLDEYEEKYRHGRSEFDWVRTDKEFPNPVTGKIEKTFQMVDKNPKEHWTDYEGMRKHEERIQEGLDLFGKYYRNLWD
jgi:hypothetical protein